MAGANKRTTCALATVAIIFIIVIIILCLVPDPCRRHDPRPECKGPKQLPYEGDFTDQQTTSTATPSTTVTTTSPRRKPTESPTTSPHPPTSTSTSPHPPTSTSTSPHPSTLTLTSPHPPTLTSTSPHPSTLTLTSPHPPTSTSTSPHPPTSTSTSPHPPTFTSTSTSPHLSTSTSTSPHPPTFTSTSTSPHLSTSTLTSPHPPTLPSTSPHLPTLTSTSPHPPTSTSTSLHPSTSSSTSPHPPTSASTLPHPPISTPISPHPPTSTSTSPHPPTLTSTSTSPHPPTSTSTSPHPPTLTSTSPHPPTSTSTSTSPHPPTLTSTSPHPPTLTSTSPHPPTLTSTSPHPPTLTSTSPHPPTLTSTSPHPPTLTSTSPHPPTSTSTSPHPSTLSSTSKSPHPSTSTSTSPHPPTSTSTSTSPHPPTSTSTPASSTSTSPHPPTSTSTSPHPPTLTSTSPHPPTLTSMSPHPPTFTSTSITPNPPTSASTFPHPPTSTSTSPHPPTSTSTSPHSPTSTSTSPHPPTSTSTFSSSTSSLSSIWSTEESPLEENTNGAESSTHSTESSLFADEDALKEVCDTKVCREVARRMLDMMDPEDVDPCDDFYQYSCGGVLDDHFLKPEDPQVFADKIIKEALTYGPKDDEDLKELFVTYDSCLNYSSYDEAERLTRAREVFMELGYQFSPLTDSDFDLGEALLKMMKRHFAPFFDINIDIARDETQPFRLTMVLPTAASAFTNERAKDICVAEYKAKEEEAKYKKLAFDINSQYEDYVKCMKHGRGLQVRMQHIQRSVAHLGLLDDTGNKTTSKEVQSQAIVALKNMLEELANAIPPIQEIRRALVNKDYEEFTLADIDSGTVFGDLPFKMDYFIENLLDIPIKEPKNTKIQVYSKEVFTKLFEIISGTYIRQKPLMQDIMMLLWVEHIYDDLISPVGAPPGSLDYCFDTVTKLMDDYVSYLYLTTMPERQTLESQMKRMIDLTAELMKSQVETSGLESDNDFIEELNKMNGEFANLDEAKTALHEDKEDSEISMVGNNFTENYIILMKNYRKRLYRIFQREPTDYRTLWSFLQFPYRHTGVTSYGLNKLLIPHGAMSPPYYYEDAPSYINYAGLGHMIAHELLHSFDSKGMKFNSEGNSPMIRDHTLTKNRDCLSQQLSGISSVQSSKGSKYNFKLPQSLHLDELLADIAAPNLAWNAYNKDLTYDSTPTTTNTPMPRPPGIVARRRRSAESMFAASRNESHALGITDTSLHEKHLVHWEDKTIQQIYFIKTAQNQCSSTSGLDLLEVMENKHLPPKLRVNLQLGNNEMFMKAFNCDRKPNPKMKPPAGVCFYNPSGQD